MMKVSSVSVTHYGQNPEGSFNVHGGDTSVTTRFTPEEAHRVQALVLDIFRDRQQALAQSISEMSVPLLGAPPQEAEFTDVIEEPTYAPPQPPVCSVDDDLPF